jgi:hypothetical protein
MEEALSVDDKYLIVILVLAILFGASRLPLLGDTLDDVVAAAERGIRRIRGTPHLAFSFLRYCGLSLW